MTSRPFSAITFPRAITISIGRATRSDVRIRSPRRPGVIEPSSALKSEMLGGIERRHLDRRDGLQPLRDGVADDAVHVSFVDQRSRMAVVGAEDEVAGIEPAFGHRLDLRRDIVPGGAEPKHRAHSLADARDRVVGARAFMVVRRSAGGIGVEGAAEIGGRVVAADRLSGELGRSDLAKHFRVAADRRRGNSSSRRAR